MYSNEKFDLASYLIRPYLMKINDQNSVHSYTINIAILIQNGGISNSFYADNKLSIKENKNYQGFSLFGISIKRSESFVHFHAKVLFPLISPTKHVF